MPSGREGFGRRLSDGRATEGDGGSRKRECGNKSEESHHIKGFVLVWDNEPGRKQVRGPDVRQTERKESKKGGL